MSRAAHLISIHTYVRVRVYSCGQAYIYQCVCVPVCATYVAHRGISHACKSGYMYEYQT